MSGAKLCPCCGLFKDIADYRKYYAECCDACVDIQAKDIEVEETC